MRGARYIQRGLLLMSIPDYGNLFRDSGVQGILDYIQTRLRARDLSGPEALALISAVHRQLGRSAAPDAGVYQSYSKVMESLRQSLPDVHEFVVSAWRQRGNTNLHIEQGDELAVDEAPDVPEAASSSDSAPPQGTVVAATPSTEINADERDESGEGGESEDDDDELPRGGRADAEQPKESDESESAEGDDEIGEEERENSEEQDESDSSEEAEGDDATSEIEEPEEEQTDSADESDADAGEEEAGEEEQPEAATESDSDAESETGEGEGGEPEEPEASEWPEMEQPQTDEPADDLEADEDEGAGEA